MSRSGGVSGSAANTAAGPSAATAAPVRRKSRRETTAARRVVGGFVTSVLSAGEPLKDAAVMGMASRSLARVPPPLAGARGWSRCDTNPETALVARTVRMDTRFPQFVLPAPLLQGPPSPADPRRVGQEAIARPTHSNLTRVVRQDRSRLG